ncbi:MAG: hypothetical protein IJA43_08735 [Clostridia bacterium]|nr:hypothetical protein [Clostridia bacterium]
MKRKILVILATIVAILLLLFAICFVVFGIASFKGYGVMEGKVLVTNTGYMIIDDDNSPIEMSNQSENEEIFKGLTSGDKILIVHDGIQESFPAGTGVYYCKKLADGEYKDLPEQVIVSLIELGYIDTPPATQTDMTFSATSYRSHNTPSGIKFPQIRVIKSVEDLNEYVKEFNNEFSEECKKYDEEYFKGKPLIVVILEEGSSSITHTVTALKRADSGKLYAYIDVNLPETGDSDMAYWHIFIELENRIIDYIDDPTVCTDDPTDITWLDIELVFNWVELGTGELVKVEKDNRMLSLIVPDGWEYATYETLEHKELSDLAYTFFIEFWPEGKTQGSLLFAYDENFGVCGTGLTSEEVIFGGHIGSMGTYDNDSMFSFIVFDQDYVILNFGADNWWNEHGTEAIEILDTLEYR